MQVLSKSKHKTVPVEELPISCGDHPNINRTHLTPMGSRLSAKQLIWYELNQKDAVVSELEKL